MCAECPVRRPDSIAQCRADKPFASRDGPVCRLSVQCSQALPAFKGNATRTPPLATGKPQCWHGLGGRLVPPQLHLAVAIERKSRFNT